MPKRVRQYHIDYLDKLYGKDSAGLLKELDAIVTGKHTQVEQRMDKNGNVREEVSGASWGDRISAIKILLEYHQGKPEKTVNLNVRQAPKRWDPDRLSLAQLAQLEAILK